jgi:signal transduction histidine kinase
VESLVQAEIARVSRLVDDLLLLAKAEQPRFIRSQQIDVPAFVEELWRTMTTLAGRHRPRRCPRPLARRRPCEDWRRWPCGFSCAWFP